MGATTRPLPAGRTTGLSGRPRQPVSRTRAGHEDLIPDVSPDTYIWYEIVLVAGVCAR